MFAHDQGNLVYDLADFRSPGIPLFLKVTVRPSVDLASNLCFCSSVILIAPLWTSGRSVRTAAAGLL